MRLIDFLDRGAALAPPNICMKDDEREATYGELVKESHRVARAIAAVGVKPGEVVATLGANSLAYFGAVLGIVRAGAVWLPINARYGGEELRHALASNDCVLAFCDAQFADSVETIRPELPGLRGVIAIDRATATAPHLDAWSGAHPADPVDIEQGPDTVIAIRSTGGTTGPSKGVMITNRIYETLFASLFSTLPFPRDAVHLAVAPLSHAAGTLGWVTIAQGGRSVIMKRFDAEEVLRRIQDEHVTHVFLTPTMLYMLLDCPRLREFDYSSLHTVIYSGAPMSVEKLKAAIEVFGPVFAQAFGQAEAPFFCTILTPAEHVPLDDPAIVKRLASCGRATLYTRVEIMAADGRLLGPGERGEIVVRGELVMKGYYRNPEATARASRFGWHHTGDVGYKDEDGYLYIVDRERDVIISGGFNIFPNEIEQVIWAHPAVQDCAVIGVPDELWGEAVKAVVELRPERTLDEREIIALCAERLGRMKAPKSVEIWPELPRSAVGKVLKKDIRAHYWVGRARSV